MVRSLFVASALVVWTSPAGAQQSCADVAEKLAAIEREVGEARGQYDKSMLFMDEASRKGTVSRRAAFCIVNQAAEHMSLLDASAHAIDAARGELYIQAEACDLEWSMSPTDPERERALRTSVERTLNSAANIVANINHTKDTLYDMARLAGRGRSFGDAEYQCD